MSLSADSQLSHERLWQEMRRLLERVVRVVDHDSFLDECLDTLVELFGADRGLILLSDSSGGTHAVNGRGQNRALSPFEREEISKTIISLVQASGESVLWEPDFELAGSESITTLGIVAALAAPLHPLAWNEAEAPANDLRPYHRGVLYLDFRDFTKIIGETHREFFEAAASLVSVVLEQGQALHSAKEHLRTARAQQPGPVPLPSLDEILSPKSMAILRAEVETCLVGDSPIFLQGQSGTGKTMLAMAIAGASGRTPVVRATLGSSDDLNTITSELFGHERGAFSGAMTKRVGMVEFADGGTLILDEILNLPLHAQQLLLDFTQFGTYRPLGYDKPEPKHATVRIIAATNGDVDQAVAEGRFRQDLYYRLAGVTLHMPALREHPEDVPAIAESFLRRTDRARQWSFSLPLRRLLMSPEIEWPGNVRQLESVIRRCCERALAKDSATTILTAAHFEPRDVGAISVAIPDAAEIDVGPGASQIDSGDLVARWSRLLEDRAALELVERDIIERALDKHGGVLAHAARELGIPRTSLVSRVSTLGIESAKRRR